MDDAKFKIVLIAIATLFCSMLILVGIYPYHPKSFNGWIVLYLISLPITVIFEMFGEKIFSDKLSKKLGHGTRIIYGVIILGLLMLLSVTTVSWLEPHLVKWHS